MKNFVKRIFVCAAAAVLLLNTGCSVSETVDDVRGDLFEKVKFDDDSNYTAVEAPKSVDCEYYEANSEITFGFESLYTDSQKDCYKMISESAYKVSEELSENGLYAIGKVTVSDKNFSEKDMDICIKAYTMDHPEVFWIANRYTYGSAGSQSVIQLYSYISGTQCAEYTEKLNDRINEIILSIPDGLKQYHLEKHIHNAVVDSCTYSKGVKTAEDGWEDFTVYGALVNGRAVCEGYAHSMCLLLNKVGIQCYYANGYGENAPHMWNIVNIGGNWYHLDVTWDDNENAYYNYFNLTDEAIKTDHIISPLLDDIKEEETLGDVYNLFLPECNSDSANFFVVESTYIYDFDESQEIMVQDLINAAENKDEIFTVKVDSSIDFNEAIDLLFNEEPYYMFKYIHEANTELDGDNKINEKNVSIIILDSFNSVVVHLKYE